MANPRLRPPDNTHLKWWWGWRLFIVSQPDKYSTTQLNSWIMILRVKVLGYRGQVEWAMHINGPVLMCRCVIFCDSRFNGFCVGMGCMIWVTGCLIHHHAKFSSSIWKCWSAEIAGMKNEVLDAPPHWEGMGLTPKNLPLVLTCYHAKFGSAAISPEDNFDPGSGHTYTIM